MSQATATRLPITLDWEATVRYFQERRAVLFFSYTQFWERHAFVQQSLAKELTSSGIPVHWREGDQWRAAKPVLNWESPNLDVRKNLTLPGIKYPLVRDLDRRLFRSRVNNLVKRYGNPVIWVEAGLREELARELPYIDVFSSFDDPYYICDDSVLRNKAKLFVAQNSFTGEIHADSDSKVKTLLPPIDMNFDLKETATLALPLNFPAKVMGYIGSFFTEDYDLELFEYLVRTLPDWGFLLAGRTDAEGERKVEWLKRYPNFHHVGWLPREQSLGLWGKLSATLLLHRPRRTQYGAFPTKVVESTYFGVPCVGTRVPKTEDLEGLFPLSSHASELRRLAVEVTFKKKEEIRKIYDYFREKTDPKKHLATVAQALSSSSVR